jgi:lipoyl(octanoyl) transferase
LKGLLTSEDSSNLLINDLWLIPYEQALQLQRDLLQKVISGDSPETLILCEHPAVITHGRGANPDNLLTSIHELKNLGISVIEIERGGDYTWHGPGQIVAYPLLDLRKRKQDVGWYLRKLENVIISLLARYQISAQRICDKTGVWIEDRKIASIGVKLSRWCTMHGFSLNYSNCSAGFNLIRACGLPDLKVTSIIQECPNLSAANLGYAEVAADLVECFKQEFCTHGHEEKNCSKKSPEESTC